MTFASRAAEAPSEAVFQAEVLRIELLSKHQGPLVARPPRTRFVATLKLLEDVANLGTKGAEVALGIHSPARDLNLKVEDIANERGRPRLFRLTRNEVGAWHRLWWMPLPVAAPEV